MQQQPQNSGSAVGGPGPVGSNSEPSAAASTFAGLLAAFARSDDKPLPPWNDDGLAEDVATISYERALRAHARYRPRELDDRSLTQAPGPKTAPVKTFATGPAIETNEPASVPSGLKSASITLRMSHAECEQLRRRAAEAGLTVSAYLRSCAFEVESLRAQVKEAVAKMRLNAPPEAAVASNPARPSWFRRVISR
jgi:Mobilization protein NikA